MRNWIFIIVTFFCLKSQGVSAEIPQTQITNGLITAKLFLPDTAQGYYRGSRFDWSGVIAELKYKRHDYFGQWFPVYNPKTHDAICGPVEEFMAINYDQASTGGEFLRIGIGGLRKPDENKFERFGYYDISNPGKWTVKNTGDCVVFTHQLADVEGYSYVYEKKVRLIKGKPQMVLEHSLKNTGKKAIQTSVYCHNFFTIDHQTTGPNSVVKFAFPASGTEESPLAKINGRQVEYFRELSPRETATFGEIQGHSKSVKDYDFRIENRKTGAGVRITGDRPISKIIYWSSVKTQCPEPYIDINVEPGKTFTWTITYDFYTALSIEQEKNGVKLSWDKTEGATGYNLYRSDSRYGDYHLITKPPVKNATFFDDHGKYAYYQIAPVIDNKEGALSAPQSLEMELFGENTYIFDPNDVQKDIKQVIDTITTEMANGKISQFTNKRVAFLFKPGDYGWLQFENGFYMQVAGLGKLPTDTKIDKVYVTTDWLGRKNATCNFWRSIENVSLLNKDGKMLIYGVSQAAPLRRLMINGDINLDMGGWASGGFLANSVVTGVAGSPTQQQFFIRNNETNFKGVNWNLVSVGDKGEIEKKDNRTIIDATPVIYEKPFLFFENGDYFVFVPGRIENAVGASWSNGKTEDGKVIPLSDFYIAHDNRDDAKTINAALDEGKNILFTPGIYKVSEAIEVTRANTVVLGLGMATIQPTNGNIGMYVSDVEGVRITGLIFDAGSGLNKDTDTGGSAILLLVGAEGSKKDLSQNPIVLSDLFFRVGGAETPLPCAADISLEINANSTIGDHFWIWRADHGGKVGWDLNKANYGLIVNGDDVTVYGLFVEHYQKYDTYWTGDNGRMYFYQNEKAYDVPTQKDWAGPDGNHYGWAAYRVDDKVQKHEAYGVGVYSVFNKTKEFVALENAIVTPTKGDIVVRYPFTVNLSSNGGIEHIINGLGGPHTTKDSQRGSLKTLPKSFNNVWRSTK